MISAQAVSGLNSDGLQKIPEIIRSLSVVLCDGCKREKASYDVYVDSPIAGVKFLKRLCENCKSVNESR